MRMIDDLDMALSNLLDADADDDDILQIVRAMHALRKHAEGSLWSTVG